MNKYNISLVYLENDTLSTKQTQEKLNKIVKKLFVAHSHEDALSLYELHKTDVALISLDLLHKNTEHFVQTLKNLNSHVQIIATASVHDDDKFIECIELGIKSYLKKPFTLSSLEQKLEKATKNIESTKEKQDFFHLLQSYKNTVDLKAIVSKSDTSGNITYVNKAFEKISGYKKDELLGHSHNIIRHPDMNPTVFKHLWHTIQVKKKPWYGEVQNKKKDGSSYYLKTIINPIMDENNNIIEYISIRSDITEIEKRKGHLKNQYNIKSEKFAEVVQLSKNYEAAMDKSSIIIRISKDLKINFVNKNFCELTGYSTDELINEPYFTLLDEATSRLKIHRMFKKAETFGEWKGQLQGFTKSRRQIYFTTTIIPIKDNKGNLIEYMALRNDITEIIELHKELEATQREIIYTMGEIGETRSKETGYHVKRVAEFSKLLALKAGLSLEEAELLRMASPMHDIGKVGIPDSILNKPARLTDDEFFQMKEHAKIGYDLLKNSSRKLLRTSALIAHEHHERWDGKGYPRGLKAHKIHIFGRITAVCDVFDALANERPYKKAWRLEKIIQLFQEERAKHFDPNLVDIFLENLDDFLKIKNKYIDNYDYETNHE